MSDFVPLVMNGETWRLSYVTSEMRDEYSTWAAVRAILELDALKKALPPALYAERSRELEHSISAGSYRWQSHQKKPQGPGIARMMQANHGAVRLLQMLLKEAHGDVPEEKVLAILTANTDMEGNPVGAAVDQAVAGPNASGGSNPPPNGTTSTTPSRTTTPA